MPDDLPARSPMSGTLMMFGQIHDEMRSTSRSSSSLRTAE
jgi:hypothetical protein